MDGPLHPVLYDTGSPVPSWWEASAGPDADRPPLGADTTADVAIVGGGFCGLAAARRLAELGRSVVVLEAGPLGWGASGRNGGIAGIGSHKAPDRTMRRRWGAAEVDRYLDEQARHLRWLRAFCAEAGVPVQGSGEVEWAHSARAARAMAGWRGASALAVEPVAATGRSDLSRHGGQRLRDAFGVHPLRLVRALAGRAEAAGVRIHPRSEALARRREGARHRLVTAAGSVLADRVLFATNGFPAERLAPELAGRAIPVLSNIVVTRPLTADERAALPWLGDDPMCDSRHLLAYLRLLPKDRLLFGMRGDITGAPARAGAMRARVERRLAEALPPLAGIRIDHFWRGPICATARLTPSVGLWRGDPTLAFAFGWHGSGVNGAQLGGRWIAEVMAGAPESRIPAPCRGLAPRVPLAALRPLCAGVAMAAFRVLDALS